MRHAHRPAEKKRKLLNSDEFVLSGTDTEFFGMDEAGFPVRVWVCHVEDIVIVFVVILRADLALYIDWLSVCGIDTSLIKGDGIERCEHADIGDERDVIFGIAVAVG